MAMMAGLVRETARIKANIEGAAVAQERLTDAAAATATELAKSSLRVAPPPGFGGGIVNPAGQPISSGGGSGSSGGGSGGGGGRVNRALPLRLPGIPGDPGTTKPMEQWTSDDWDDYYRQLGQIRRLNGLPISGRGSGGGGGSSGGGGPRRLFPELIPAGNNRRGVPITPAGGNLLGVPITQGGGKSTVFDPAVAGLLANAVTLLSRIADGVRDDNGAGLRRQGLI